MRKLSLSLLLLLGSISVGIAQTAKWDSTYRPGNFELKNKEFESYKTSPKDIIFLGNSITAGVQWNELLQSKHAKNRGISADITFGVLERLEPIIQGKPAKLFLLIGINDISRNIPDEVIIANYKKIVDRIRRGSPKTKIYVQTLMPVNHTFEKFPNHYKKDDHILKINTMIRSLADNRSIFLVDLYPRFLDENNRLSSELTHDGLHLTSEGYAVWADLLKAEKHIK